MEQNQKRALPPMDGLEALRQENARLRAELSSLIFARDELLLYCRELENTYLRLIGGLVNAALEAQYDALYYKRLMEELRALKNQQRQPTARDAARAAAALGEEFEAYWSEVEEQNERVEEARSSGPAEGEEALKSPEAERKQQELKALYRRIVKALHPDLNPDVTQDQLNLFYAASDAYQTGDLQALRAIAELLDSPGLAAGFAARKRENEREQLLAERERLRGLIEHIKAEIARIRATPPYTLKHFLEDPLWVKTEQKKYKQLLKQYRAERDYYLSEIEKLTGTGRP